MMFGRAGAPETDLHRASAAVGSPVNEAACSATPVPAIDRALESLAIPGVRLGARVISSADVFSLHAVEHAAIDRAVPARRSEFATGRALLRSLLGEDVPIQVAPDRAPVLPPGVKASLAHDRRFAVAAVSRAAGVRSLGIDIEPMTRLSTEMAAVIVRSDEGLVDPHLTFTLKEATYKAWSRLGGRMLDFHEVRVTVGVDSFVAEVLHTGTCFDGRFVDAGDRWIAFVVVADTDDRTARRGGDPAPGSSRHRRSTS